MKRAMNFLLAAVAGIALAVPAAAQDAPLKMWRLDCGTVAVNDLNSFSDTHAYPEQSRVLTSSCYLIQHGSEYLLWDTGLPAAIKSKPLDRNQPMDATISLTIKEQLAILRIDPARVTHVGVSHYHFDHVGQLADFPAAKLIIGKADWAVLKDDPKSFGADPAPFAHWLSGGGKVDAAAADSDVFGDGSVTLLRLPGHTPGHTGLLVRLKGIGPVLLSGDLAHFTENYASNGVPLFNVSRAETLASLDRFKKLADNLKATVIIQHEPADIVKLPAFPQAAE